MEFAAEGLQIPPDEIATAFAPVAKTFEMRYEVRPSNCRTRVAMLVSKQDHCLADLLQRHKRDELHIDIPVIISNHDTCAGWAELFKIPFSVCPVTKETKPQQEQQVLSLLKDHRVELVVMARYMQILSASFLSQVGCPVINIHHSFLPAFMGANPYRQAYERGVKIIGATAHYATDDLDEGPIIEQDVMRVGHRDTVDDLVRKGRDLERLCWPAPCAAMLNDGCWCMAEKPWCLISRTLKKPPFSPTPTPAATSPARPEAAKTASLPRDAPFPMHRSRIVQTLNVPHMGNELLGSSGLGG